ALNDSQIPSILESASQNGASSAFMTLLRLPAEVKPVFVERLAAEYPDRHLKILSQLQEMKGGKYNISQFGKRMKGEGSRWDAINWLFTQNCKRLKLDRGFESERNDSGATTFFRPRAQLALFE